jgi:hypothetical protein
MIISIDFDGTLVSDDRKYEDVETPLTLLTGARAAVYAMRRAGHTLILASSRSNRALREDWQLNPLWKMGLTPFSQELWERSLLTNQKRYEQMVAFVSATLPDVFACIDDGHQGKVSADVYIDDRALRFGEQVSWDSLESAYGVPVF